MLGSVSKKQKRGNYLTIGGSLILISQLADRVKSVMRAVSGGKWGEQTAGRNTNCADRPSHFVMVALHGD